jgi:hypothetical protein
MATPAMPSTVRRLRVSKGTAKRCRIMSTQAREGARFDLEASGNGNFTVLVPNSLLEIGSFARDVCNHVLT